MQSNSFPLELIGKFLNFSKKDYNLNYFSGNYQSFASTRVDLKYLMSEFND